ncbi:histidine kinase N-terminal 7TM domain-containing diguanylate cyclase [Clostridium magnum]|uniref:Putative diguanylate cyclase YcdT n=1 Tax=Clostridium magnum DSM 2767 TaxID=1121326 RepID=A0A168DV93_9CLOT|nr:diguanylate cyclase [Clostridium magnum]KZL91511.1 putative diguanylate cyclase YcdT [Clostridium magnum DSM 2767]SHH45478.1 diguanylate cyclase (GGDEF) domain-containing protein [Clostridium magnum DSM 2767]
MGISVILVLISTIIILTSIIYVGTRKSKKQFHYVYMMLVSSVLIWCIGALGEVATEDVYHFDPFIQTCNYFGIALVSVFILLLGVVFTHTRIVITSRFALLFILPIGSAIAVATNERHHLFMKVFCIIIKDAVLGPLMWAHYIYCYIFIAIGMSYLIKYAVNNSGLFSKQAMTLVAGMCTPLAINVLTSFGIISGGCYSTIPGIVIMILLIGIATLKLDMFNIVPIALQKIVDHISDGFIVIDENRKIIDSNKAAQLWLSDKHEIRRNQDFKEFMDSLKIENLDTSKLLDYIKMSFEKKDSISFDTLIKFENGICYFNIEVTPMFSKNKYIGTIILYRNTTKYIENLQMIKEYQLLLENNLEKVTRDKQELLIRSAIMEKMSKTDALTDMYNHRTFQEYFDTIIDQASRADNRFQLALLDIDNFKKINDTFGHSVGDIILKRISSIIKTMVTVDDISARYGGEEFALILTNKTLEQSLALLESIRKAIQDESHIELNSNVTVSVGVHEYYKGEPKEELFNKADEALYKAKHSGKNKIVASTVYNLGL